VSARASPPRTGRRTGLRIVADELERAADADHVLDVRERVQRELSELGQVADQTDDGLVAALGDEALAPDRSDRVDDTLDVAVRRGGSHDHNH
jgi:hypothetical protein